jgi:hypothetical protein
LAAQQYAEIRASLLVDFPHSSAELIVKKDVENTEAEAEAEVTDEQSYCLLTQSAGKER